MGFFKITAIKNFQLCTNQLLWLIVDNNSAMSVTYIVFRSHHKLDQVRVNLMPNAMSSHGIDAIKGWIKRYYNKI